MSYADIVLDDSPLLYWPMTSGTAVDSSGNGYNGTLTLASTRTEHQSATKQALINNGSGFKWDDFSVEAP